MVFFLEFVREREISKVFINYAGFVWKIGNNSSWGSIVSFFFGIFVNF